MLLLLSLFCCYCFTVVIVNVIVIVDGVVCCCYCYCFAVVDDAVDVVVVDDAAFLAVAVNATVGLCAYHSRQSTHNKSRSTRTTTALHSLTHALKDRRERGKMYFEVCMR